MANLLGTLVGASLDRRDGDSGIKGAVIGFVVEGVAKRLLPAAFTGMLGLAAIRYARRALAKRSAVAG